MVNKHREHEDYPPCVSRLMTYEHMKTFQIVDLIYVYFTLCKLLEHACCNYNLKIDTISIKLFLNKAVL